jgi:hypothetical protein
MLRFSTTTLLVCGAALLQFAACSSSDGSSVQQVHEFTYDPATQEYTVLGEKIPAALVQRDLAGNLCSKCHLAAVAEVKDSVHFKEAGPTQRVLFPGGGAHGMLDRACGLPATTGLTNFTSDINLGECSKCHIGRYLPVMEGFFTSMFQQMGLPDAAAQAAELVDGGIDCLVCHAETYRSYPAEGTLAVLSGVHPADGASPTPTGYARCARDNSDFDHDGTPDAVLDMNGDGVKDTPLMFDSDGNGQPDTPWPTVAQDRSVAALQSIGATTEHACLRCHEHARTGYKRGTLFVDGHDVHASMATGPFAGADNQCIACHTAAHHKFVRGHNVGGDLAAADHPAPAAGTAFDPNDATDLACRSCHDPATLSTTIHMTDHLDVIACETCHIPYGSGITYSLFGHGGQVSFGRNDAGKDTKLIVADMYMTGDRADLDADWEAYKGRPILSWFNGGTSFLAQSLAARGSPNAKITPFKPMANGLVFDARFFDGVMLQNEASASYNAHSMYGFYANGNNAEVFAALGMLDMTPTAVRNVTLAAFADPDPRVQAMGLMLIFPNLVYFDKANFGFEHYMIRTGSPFDANNDGIIDQGQPFLFDMLAAANAGLRQFQGFNGPMQFPAAYEWYPPFTDVAQPISMKLPDGSLIKMFLQMQAQSMDPTAAQAWLAAIADYPAFSQVTLGGHGVRPKEQALGQSCMDCHGGNGVLAHPVPVGQKVLTAVPGMGSIELPRYQWKFYNVRALVELGLSTTSEAIVASSADVDIDGDTSYVRLGGNDFVINWFAPDTAGGYFRPDDAAVLAGTGLTSAELTWSGGQWMPVLEPVVDLLPNWRALGLPSTVIW